MQQRVTPVVLNLLILNGLVFLAWQIEPLQLLFAKYFVLWKIDLIYPRPEEINGLEFGFRPVQLITWFFSQHGFMHLLFNALGLFFFGPMVEMAMGAKRFLAFYLFVGIVSGLAVALFDPSYYHVLGASGAISGVLIAFAFYYPDLKMSMLFLPFIQFKAIYFVLGLFVISAANVFVFSRNDGISHFGHLMGMVIAILYFVVDTRLLKLRK